MSLAEEQTQRPPKISGAFTDAEGHFEIDMVIPCRYRFEASHPGYVDQEDQQTGSESGAVLALSSGQQANDVLFRLVRAGAIAGHFLDVADGYYEFIVTRPEAEWYVKAAQPGADDVLEKGMQVENGSSPGALEVVLSKGVAQLEGSVTDGDKPVAAAEVRLTREPATPCNRAPPESAMTDQKGHFLLNHVPPGTYRVIARIPPGAPDVPSQSSEPKVVTLGEHDHQQLSLTLRISTANN